jgi:hypothetical protein
VLSAAEVGAAVRDGALLGVQYNPLIALGSAALAAALWGHRKVKRDHRWWAWIALVVGWLAGDGLRVLGRARDYWDASAGYAASGLPLWPGWTNLAVWAVVSLALGYVVPAVVGGAVGRRVTHGTGWLAAAAIAAALSAAVSAAVGAFG